MGGPAGTGVAYYLPPTFNLTATACPISNRSGATSQQYANTRTPAWAASRKACRRRGVLFRWGRKVRLGHLDDKADDAVIALCLGSGQAVEMLHPAFRGGVGK